jgi:hypothetical protein
MRTKSDTTSLIATIFNHEGEVKRLFKETPITLMSSKCALTSLTENKIIYITNVNWFMQFTDITRWF